MPKEYMTQIRYRWQDPDTKQYGEWIYSKISRKDLGRLAAQGWEIEILK